ncbi:MAG: PIN domain-containing protein [Phycisphaerae bacterium]
MRQVFIDTSFLLALTVADDDLHARAVAWQRVLRVPLVTSQFVLLEYLDALARPQEKQLALATVELLQSHSAIEIIPLSEALLAEGIIAMRTYADKEWGITDCISFHLMRQRSILAALTHDRHFEQAGFEALLRREPPTGLVK